MTSTLIETKQTSGCTKLALTQLEASNTHKQGDERAAYISAHTNKYWIVLIIIKVRRVSRAPITE